MNGAKQNAILCVDDETIVTKSLKTLFSKKLKDIKVVEIAHSGEEALEIMEELEEDGIELQTVIVDYNMPGMKGDELLVEIHKKKPKVKKIMLTGQSGISGIAKAINEAELYRFMEKPWNNEDMVLTIKGALKSYLQESELEKQNTILRQLNEELEEKVKERTKELEKKNKELERISITDRLTNVYNRVKLDRVLDKVLKKTQKFSKSFGLILIDIDHFKSVNDAYGHQAGDLILVEIANVLKNNMSNMDIVGTELPFFENKQIAKTLDFIDYKTIA